MFIEFAKLQEAANMDEEEAEAGAEEQGKDIMKLRRMHSASQENGHARGNGDASLEDM